MAEKIWITWENQRRNRELSQALNARLFELKEIDQVKNPIKKYALGIFKTISILLRERPAIIFCQNPSLILSAFLVTVRKLARCKVVVDAHNAGLFPKEGKSFLLIRLARYIQRKADLTIVTNQGLKEHVEKNQGKAFILQDRIPGIASQPPKQLAGGFNILFICSYADDEPYEEVFEAASMLDSGIHIFVTGNYKKKNIDPTSISHNVTLLGFIPEDSYVQMLHSVDATIDLTTREDCLVCGAYEAVAVEKPQILSDTSALRGYFRKGVVYTENYRQTIVDAIHSLIADKDLLIQETKELKKELRSEWNKRKNDLERILEGLINSRNRAK